MSLDSSLLFWATLQYETNRLHIQGGPKSKPLPSDQSY